MCALKKERIKERKKEGIVSLTSFGIAGAAFGILPLLMALKGGHSYA